MEGPSLEWMRRGSKNVEYAWKPVPKLFYLTVDMLCASTVTMAGKEKSHYQLCSCFIESS